jgi:hypothetical protein
MDSLQDILGGRNFTPPNEIQLVKDYVSRRYSAKCYIRIERGVMTLSVASSALAGTLQLERNRLIEACNIRHRLVIRTGRQ